MVYGNRKTTLCALDDFLRLVERSCLVEGLRGNYCKGKYARRLTALFNETGIMGPLGASAYGALNIVSPSIGATIDQLCRPHHGSIKKTFTLYVGLQIFVHCRGMRTR